MTFDPLTRARGPRRRARELGIPFGRFPTGPFNAITDVSDVRVGHATVVRGEGAHARGVGPVRTGVTAILPMGGDVFHSRCAAGGFVLNGAGEVAGMTQLLEWGLLETPILLTDTMNVGRVAGGTVRYMLDRFPGIGTEHDVIIPVVGECDDSWLSDVAGEHVTDAHVFEALDGARGGPVTEGSVGAGTGMTTCDFAGGIGTASRVLPDGHVVGVLVLSNFGHMVDLRVDGVPVGRSLAARYPDEVKRRKAYGSIISVVATSAPLLPHQLSRVAKRSALGIGRAGSYAAHGSGEIVVAFSTGNVIPREDPRESRSKLATVTFLLDTALDGLYEAACDATEEAILNALCMSPGQDGIDGRFSPPLPLDDLQQSFGEARDWLRRRTEFPPPPSGSGA